MNLAEFRSQLAAHPDLPMVIALPDGTRAPFHFHVTEVGHITKRFVDCGGKFRSSETCVLQTWTGVTDDDGHRLTAGKLAKILDLAGSILPSAEIPVEIEHEAGVISQYPVEGIAAVDGVLTVQLTAKHTDCLAREQCSPADGGDCGCEPEATECCAVAGQTNERGCC
jgi:hypothetical protein